MDEELFWLLMLIGALGGAFGPIGPVVAIMIHAAMKIYYGAP